MTDVHLKWFALKLKWTRVNITSCSVNIYFQKFDILI
jgi:hypothetical protein